VTPWGRAFLTVVVYAAAMGWLEAVVVVYIRALLGIRPAEGYPAAAEVLSRIQSIPWLMRVEQSREVATMVMLAGVGWLAGRDLRSRFGAFIAAFGVWDIAYYLALYALLRWPPSVASMDLLFLIPPHPLWYQPVWLPSAIAAGMVVGGAWLMRERRG
jgi:hypothetical protein